MKRPAMLAMVVMVVICLCALSPAWAQRRRARPRTRAHAAALTAARRRAAIREEQYERALALARERVSAMSRCREAALAQAGADGFAGLDTALAACAPGAPSGSADLLRARRLATIAAGLRQQQWEEAAVGMRQLAAAAPATAAFTQGLDATLAPAFVRFGTGAPAAAAVLARAPARRADALAAPFQQFLQHEFVRRSRRTLALPGLAAFLVVLVASLVLGLRRTVLTGAGEAPPA